MTLLYDFKSKQTKADILLGEISKDPLYENILQTLKRPQIDFSFGNVTGAYSPVFKLSDTAKFVPSNVKISLSRWPSFLGYYLGGGISGNLHYLLHELYHAWQDYHNILYTSQLADKKDYFRIPTQKNAEEIYLFCEALAAAEAISASYRLYKQHNIPYAWRGCYYSCYWRDLSRLYLRNIRNKADETSAAKAIFQQWYDDKNITSYKKEALSLYEYIQKNNIPKEVDSDFTLGGTLKEIFAKKPNILPYYIKEIYNI